MTTREIIKAIEEAAMDSFYANHLMHLYLDILDGIEEGYLTEISASMSDGILIRCENGSVRIKTDGNKLIMRDLSDERKAIRRTASPYERTRAMVYATGNRWAIENFNATH